MNLADALLGTMPTISPSATRAIKQFSDAQTTASSALTIGADKSRKARSEECRVRYRQFFLRHFVNRAFSHGSAIRELKASNEKAGRSAVQRTIDDMIDNGELRVLKRIQHESYEYIFYVLTSATLSENELLAQTINQQTHRWQNQRISVKNQIRQWERAKTGFTQWQAKHYTKSDAFSRQAIDDMLASGELSQQPHYHPNGKLSHVIYKLTEKATQKPKQEHAA